MRGPVRVVWLVALALTPACHEDQPPKPRPSVGGDETAPIATVDGVTIGPARFNLIMHARLRPRRAATLLDRAVVDLKLALAGELIDDQIVDAAAHLRGVVVADTQIDAALAELQASFSSRAAWN